MRLTRSSFPVNWVGFDSLFSELDRLSGVEKTSNWPPYNIKKNSETSFSIEIALSGYSEKDIEISIKDSELVVQGKPVPGEEQAEYLYKGIAERTFSRTFTLSSDVVVKTASMLNGMLKIELEKIIPQEKLPRKIPIEISGQSLLK